MVKLEKRSTPEKGVYFRVDKGSKAGGCPNVTVAGHQRLHARQKVHANWHLTHVIVCVKLSHQPFMIIWEDFSSQEGRRSGVVACRRKILRIPNYLSDCGLTPSDHGHNDTSPYCGS